MSDKRFLIICRALLIKPFGYWLFSFEFRFAFALDITAPYKNSAYLWIKNLSERKIPMTNHLCKITRWSSIRTWIEILYPRARFIPLRVPCVTCFNTNRNGLTLFNHASLRLFRFYSNSFWPMRMKENVAH